MQGNPAPYAVEDSHKAVVFNRRKEGEPAPANVGESAKQDQYVAPIESPDAGLRMGK